MVNESKMTHVWWGQISEKIAGKIIASFSHDDIRIWLTFTDGSRAHAVTEGDCCSSTWIEHITIPPDVEGATVFSVEDTDEVEGKDADDDGEYVRVYGTSIKTNRGEIIVEYRNASNGYYGGSLDWYI